jgi:hypothetical protein
MATENEEDVATKMLKRPIEKLASNRGRICPSASKFRPHRDNKLCRKMRQIQSIFATDGTVAESQSVKPIIAAIKRFFFHKHLRLFLLPPV